MKKTDELRQKMAAKKLEVTNFQKDNKIEDAVKAAEELKILNQQFQIEKALEDATFENFMKHKEQVTPTATDAATLRKRAFNKLVLNPARKEPIPLTDEERAAYFNVTGSPGQPAQIEGIDTKGGYLVPQEQMATLQEFRKDFVTLKNYVSVVSTNTTSGRWATFTQQNLKFQKFAEMSNIPETDVTFGEATYLIEDWGLTVPISKQLIADANIDILSFMGRQLVEGVVATENEEILKPLNKLITGDTATNIAEATTINSHSALNTAMIKTLDGVYYNAAKIFTNQDGFLWLANMEDTQKRPLFQPDISEPNKYLYRGKEIVVIPNTQLPNTTISNKAYAPIWIGDLRSYITFFERQGIELVADSSVFFRKYGIGLQGVVRFGVVVTDSNAMTALKVEV